MRTAVPVETQKRRRRRGKAAGAPTDGTRPTDTRRARAAAAAAARRLRTRCTPTRHCHRVCPAHRAPQTGRVRVIAHTVYMQASAASGIKRSRRTKATRANPGVTAHLRASGPGRSRSGRTAAPAPPRPVSASRPPGLPGSSCGGCCGLPEPVDAQPPGPRVSAQGDDRAGPIAPTRYHEPRLHTLCSARKAIKNICSVFTR